MLKWTKLYRKENEVTRNDNKEITQTHHKYPKDDTIVGLPVTRLSASNQRPDRRLFHSLRRTSQSRIRPEETSISGTETERVNQRDKLNLITDSNSSILPNSSRNLQSSSTLSPVKVGTDKVDDLKLPQYQTVTVEEEDVAIKATTPILSYSQIVTDKEGFEAAITPTFRSSHSQIVAREAGCIMSLHSSSSLDTAPTSIPQISTTTQSQPNTALMTTDTEIANNYPPEASASPQPTPPSAQKHPHTSSALPDIARSVPTTEREILGPLVEWERENITLEEVADMDNFPCVCLFEEHVRHNHGQQEFLNPGLKIYSHQPVLFQRRSRKKEARARTIFKDQKGAYYEVGQTMIIPDDYQGWFEVVPSDFRRATCFLSIDGVAKAMPRKFFTRSNIKGIRIEGEGDGQKYLERKVRAGSVLETSGTFTAKWKTRAETGVFRKNTKEWELQEVTYLKCIDSDQEEILIPLTHKGKFNAIYERGQLTENAVYSMKDILSYLSLPIKVRLLFGKAPVVPCIFTGMLVVRSAVIDDAIVGSTILNTRNVLFEISVNAPVKVKFISKDDSFADMSTYKDAQKLCKKYANLFSTMIKLSTDMDTDQKVIMHVPSDPSVMRQVDETLRALDLITDITFTDKPADYLLDSSDSGSMNSFDQVVMPKGGTLEKLEEFKSRESHTHV